MTPRISHCLALLSFLLAAPAASIAASPCADYEDCRRYYLPYAQRLSVSKIDPSLPDMPVEKWLKSVLGPDSRIDWELNDCGEQPGFSEPGRDYPVCVGIEASFGGNGKVTLWILVGTENTGVAPEPALYFGLLQYNGPDQDMERLGDLPALMKKGRKGAKHEEQE